MGKYSQANRPMRVDTPLETDLLLLEGFEAEEGVSRPYHYTLQLLSEDPGVLPEDLLRQPVLITLDAGEGNDPFVTHGIVRSFTALDMAEGLARYRAEVVPAYWFLTQTRDCRIFQNQSVIEIVSEVLEKPTTVGRVRFEPSTPPPRVPGRSWVGLKPRFNRWQPRREKDKRVKSDL